MNCTDEAFHGLVDTWPLVILVLGRSALLDGDVREAMYSTLWDRLVCLESLGGTVSGWREKVAKEWAKYKHEELPDMGRQLEEAKQRDKERTRALTERTAVIEEKKVERIDDQTAFILHRAELSSQIQRLIQELGHQEPLAEPLRWLRKNIDSSGTPEELSRYKESFNKTTLPKVKLRIQEIKDTAEHVKRDKALTKAIAIAAKESNQRVVRMQREKEQEEKRQRKAKILDLRANLNIIDYYLRRKDLKQGEDPVLILQQLRVIRPVEGSWFPLLSKEPVRGYWLMDRLSGKQKYNPPIHDFTDYGCKIDRLLKMVVDSKIYKGSEEVRYWTSWTNVWPLPQAKRAQIRGEITMLTGNKTMEKG